MHSMTQYKKYPRSLTQFKTSNYVPGDHFTIPKKWDNFTMHAPLWKQTLDHFFAGGKDLKFLELGSGNGLCANYMLDNYDCHVDTIDIDENHIVPEANVSYIVSTISNLQPFISAGRCTFHHTTTKEFLLANQDKQYDFIYVDASHDREWVLYDAVNAFPLLKDDGLMIFDDYGMKDCKKGVDAFLSCFDKFVEIFYVDWQLMLRKKQNLQTQ